MMYMVFALKARHELTWEDFPYIENPVFSHERAMTALSGGYDINGRRVHNIEEFKRKYVPYYSRSFNHQIVSDELRRQFFSGQFFSVARDKIPSSPSFKWRELDDHPDGGEWYVTHPIYGDLLKQKMEDLAKRLSAQRRRWMAEEAEENANAAALASVAKRVVEMREKADVDKVSRSDSKLVHEGPTIEEVKLAKSEGGSSLNMQAREKVCRYFLESNGFSESQIANAIGDEAAGIDGGVDLAKPVEIMSFPPPDEMTQYVNSHGFPGNWFDPTSNQTPDELGLSAEGRTLTVFKVPVSQGLLSCSKPIVDNWTNPSNPVSTAGGGRQLFVNDATKKAVISLNKIGV